MPVRVTYRTFIDLQGDLFSLNRLISGLADSLKTNDYILIEDDNKRCYNEEELRNALEERGII